MATHWTLGCDAADTHRLAGFWARALGCVHRHSWTVPRRQTRGGRSHREPGYDDPDGASIIDPAGKGPAIGFLRVPAGKTAKNRVHIDIRMAGEPPWDLAERAQLIRGKVDGLSAAGRRSCVKNPAASTWATS